MSFNNLTPASDSLVALRNLAAPEIQERFWSMVDASGDCWEWTGRIDDVGYGHFGARYKAPIRAHRYSYLLLVGDIPKHMVIDHLCQNRPCVNPDHLEVVTRRENWLRGTAPNARAFRQNRCRNGHPKVEGQLRCATCVRIYLKKRYPGIYVGDRTHCPQGHPYSGDNLLVYKSGRVCRECSRTYRQRRAAEEKAARLRGAS